MTAYRQLEGLVLTVDRQTDESAARVRRTRLLARVVSAVIVAASAFALVLVLADAADEGPSQSFDWLPLIESTINDVVFAAIAVLFLWALPERLERRGRLALLHQLRSLAHVIDVHQLSEDPEQVFASYRPTPASVKTDLTPEQLHHPRLLLGVAVPGREDRRPVCRVLHGLGRARHGPFHRVAHHRHVGEDLAEDRAATSPLTGRRGPVGLSAVRRRQGPASGARSGWRSCR